MFLWGLIGDCNIQWKHTAVIVNSHLQCTPMTSVSFFFGCDKIKYVTTILLSGTAHSELLEQLELDMICLSADSVPTWLYLSQIFF